MLKADRRTSLIQPPRLLEAPGSRSALQALLAQDTEDQESDQLQSPPPPGKTHCGPCFLASLPLNEKPVIGVSGWWGSHGCLFAARDLGGSKWNVVPTQKIEVEEFPNMARGVICWAIEKNDKCPLEHQKMREKISCLIAWNHRCSRGRRSWTFP